MTSAPIDRFLPGVDPGAGPAELLGVRSDDASAVSVRNALALRLAKLDEHPQGRSAEADEVRLALHVAAAQVVDAITTRGVDRPEEPERTRNPINPGVGADPRRRTLLAVLAHSGGWNRDSRHRLGAVAHAMGLSIDEAMRLLIEPVPGRAVVPRTENARAAARSASDPTKLGASPLARLLLGGAAVCALASLLLVVAIAWVVTRGDASAPPVDASSAASPAPPAVVPSAGAVAGQASTVPVDTDALERAFVDAGGDAQAFARAYEASRSGWAELEAGAFERLAFACAQAVADAGASRGSFVDAIARDLAPGAEPLAMLFATGVVARADGLGAIDAERLMPDLEMPELGAHGPILNAAGARLVGIGLRPAVPISAWIEAANAFRDQSPGAADAALVELIDRALRAGGERASEAIAASARLREWDADDAEVLVGWWDDATIPTERLAILAQELVAIGALGLDRSAVLDGRSTPEDRRLSRAALGRALGIEGEDDSSGAFPALWGDAHASLDGFSADLALNDALARRVAVLSRLSASAAVWWAGDRDGAMTLLDSLAGFDDPASANRVDLVAMTSATSAPDGVWAARYLSARGNDEERLALLGELRARGELFGPADADVLARAAMIGSSRSVRGAAQATVRGFADDAFMLNGLIEGVHSAAPQNDVSDMIAFVAGVRLPSTDDRSWRTEARRALGERFMTLVARSRGGVLDVAERATLDAYRLRLEPTGDDPEAVVIDDPLLRSLERSLPTASGDDLASVCDALWERWHASAVRVPEGAWAPRSISEIERRRAARGASGSGALQRFALAQLSLLEVMAYQVASERRERAAEVRAVLDACERAWRGSGRVMEQLVMAERAMVELWRIRLGIASASGEGA